MTVLLVMQALLFWFVALTLASALHELGHVLALVLLRNQWLALRFGAGPWIFYLRRRRPEISLALPMPLGGYCQSRCVQKTKNSQRCRRRQFIELLAGPALNLLLGALLLGFDRPWMRILGAAQVLVACSQLLPLRDYDGARLWQLLRSADNEKTH